MRRNRIGTKSTELWAWEMDDLSNMQGPLAVQQYIQLLIRNDPAQIKRIIQCPKQIDANVWQYEHVRQFIIELNLLVTTLKDVCTKQTCPNMKGPDECMYLCAAHKTALQCSAYEYMIHNLDQSTSILQNVKNYSSRVSIPEVKNLDTIVRRLYRLFSHTYYHHREIFNQFEKQMFLCQRFTEFTLKYGLLPAKMTIIPKNGAGD